jgi:hypothetical protein
MLAIKLLLKWVQNRSYDIFVYYRWALAAAVLVLFLQRSKALPVDDNTAPAANGIAPAEVTTTSASAP